MNMPYEDNTTFASNKNIPSQSREFESPSILGKRKKRSGGDESEQVTKGRKKEKSSKYRGTYWRSYGQNSSNGEFCAQISISTTYGRNRRNIYLGRFDLQADAAKAFDQALLLIPRIRNRSVPNFANETLYQAAREKEIRDLHGELKSKMKLESFAKYFSSPDFRNKGWILDKCGLSPTEESISTPSLPISPKDSKRRLSDKAKEVDENQVSLPFHDKVSFPNDSSDDETNSRQGSIKSKKKLEMNFEAVKKRSQRAYEYTGVARHGNSKFRSRISSNKKMKDLGLFQLKSDAAMVYDEAVKLLPPSVRRRKPNFDDFDKYNEARKEELQLKYDDIATDEKIDFESFAKQFPIPHDDIKQIALCEKLGLDRLDLIKSRKYTFLHVNGEVNTALHDLCWSCGKQENGCRHRSLKFPTCKGCSDPPAYIGGIKCSWCFKEDTEEAFECDGKEGKCKKQFCGDCVFMSQGGGREGADYVKRIREEGESGIWICPYCEPTPTLIALRAIPVAARVKEEEEDHYRGLLGPDHSFFPPSDDEANNAKKGIEEEVIDLVSSDEEENDEPMSNPNDTPDESMTETASSPESSSGSVKVKEEIVDSRIVQTGEANTAQFAVAENNPFTEQDQAKNEISAVEVSPTKNVAQNKDNAHLVLKQPLMQILRIKTQDMNDSQEKVITAYCKTLHEDKGCWNEEQLGFLKGLSENELEDMINFMQPLHKVMVKDWVKDL